MTATIDKPRTDETYSHDAQAGSIRPSGDTHHHQRTRPAGPIGMVATIGDRVEELVKPALRRYSVPLLRVALGIVFVWFGALKVMGATPVGDLVANTVPFIDKDFLVPALGLFEVGVGLVLMSGRVVGWAVAAMLAQLAGTFMVFVVQPGIAFQDGNPLLITMEGEFVAKNIVLITAGLVVAAFTTRRSRLPH